MPAIEEKIEEFVIADSDTKEVEKPKEVDEKEETKEETKAEDQKEVEKPKQSVEELHQLQDS
jgi:hypothetical protein